MPEAAPTAQQVRNALDELRAWPEIARSPQLADLLSYVVEKSLNGEQAAIKAYAIAVDVFGRPQSFDPQSDPIVRVQARRLRTLLEAFYRSGGNHSEVRIELPLGRYVPEFALAAPTRPVGPMVESNPVARQWPSARLLTPLLLGLGFTLIGVAIAVTIVRWTAPSEAPAVAMPSAPVVSVAIFENLTGLPELDVAAQRLETEMRDGLGRFEDIEVSRNHNNLVLTGALHGSGDQLELNAALTQIRTGEIVWNSSVPVAGVSALWSRLEQISNKVVRLLSTSRGPIQAAGRTWLTQQQSLPAHPNDYVCLLKYRQWRETRIGTQALEAIGCFQSLLDGNPNDALALAGSAAVASWRAEQEALPGDQLVAMLVNEQATVARAVTLMPNSSFVHEQQSVVLARQGSVREALVSIDAAVRLNPNNIDAIATEGLYLVLTGDWVRGAALGQEALEASPSPLPIYFVTPALAAMKDGRYADAIRYGEGLATSDSDLGPVIVLAAASLVDRQDVVDRYKPIVLGSERLQKTGVLLGLSLYLRQEVVAERVRDGLLLAGLPPNALDKPFNSDGSARNGS